MDYKLWTMGCSALAKTPQAAKIQIKAAARGADAVNTVTDEWVVQARRFVYIYTSVVVLSVVSFFTNGYY